MIKEITVTGLTIDEAIAGAKAQLNAPDDADVQIEVLELPAKKKLGLFGGSKAKVRAFYEAPDAVKPPQKAPPVKQVQSTSAAQTSAALTGEKTSAERPPAKPLPEARRDAKPQYNKPEKSAPKADFAKPESAIKEEPPRAELKDVPAGEVAPIVDYLKLILKAIGLESASISAQTADTELILNIECEEDYGILIGRRGETLDSVQYLARLFANRIKPEYGRVTINVGNYREKRESSLKALAERTASQVLRYGRKITLDPMNPYERRIIHTTVQDIKGAVSFSVGSDAERRVVIALEDGYNSRGGGFNNNNRGKSGPGGGNNRGRQSPAGQGSKAPAKDAEAVSLYGKIEPKK